MAFGISLEFEQRRCNDHKLFYCPSGHKMSYGGMTAIEREAKRAKSLETDLEWERMRSESWKRSAAAHKGQATRIRNLMAQGVCPVPGCRRNFANVKAHIASQHPDYHQHDVNP
jgi:hypothetical protein